MDLQAGVDPALLARERALKRAFEDWALRYRKSSAESAGTADVRALAREYRSLEDRHSELQAEVRSKSPHYAALTQPQPLRMRDVQARVLDEQTLLLEYALGEARSYVWAVSKEGFGSYELPPRKNIEQAARRVYERLTARTAATGKPADRRRLVQRADAEYWKEAGRLSDMILAPVASRMIGKRLVVVTDGALQYLPFAALPAPGRGPQPLPLLVEHEIVSLPSASVLALLRQESGKSTPAAKAIAVFADPVFEADDPRLRAVALARNRGTETAQRPLRPSLRDALTAIPRLASTREEAAVIVRAAPAGSTWSAIDFDASRATAITADLAQFRVVHFATHGVFDDEDPGRSGIVLSLFDKQGRPQDGLLRLRDIYGLELAADLVVLSACNTALGKAVEGEGLVGIVRGFMHAGTKRVVASHWRVDDEATGELMKRFYLAMFKEGRPPAAALREAQLAMLQQERWQAPFYWAAFVLQGEYR